MVWIGIAAVFVFGFALGIMSEQQWWIWKQELRRRKKK